MFGVCPCCYPYFNFCGFEKDVIPVIHGKYTSPYALCTLVLDGRHWGTGVKHPFYYGLTDNGNFIAYVPNTEVIESFDTTEDEKLVWISNYTSRQGYWNLDKQNSMGGVVVVPYN